ncbi:hypothetical protein XELAEV_18000588mg [Xenopus laevis]|nr:hypothetical protein XELAEV_18000588mg [Xenopus laevis]
MFCLYKHKQTSSVQLEIAWNFHKEFKYPQLTIYTLQKKIVQATEKIASQAFNTTTISQRFHPSCWFAPSLGPI